MRHRHIPSQKEKFNRKRYLTGFLFLLVGVIDIIRKKPDELVYILTSYFVPTLTYETEYGSARKDYAATYDVPKWFYEEEDNADDGVINDTADGSENIVNADVENSSGTEKDDKNEDHKEEESKPVIQNMSTGTTFTREQLSKPVFLTSKIFTVDNNTSMNDDELNIANLLDADMSLESLRADGNNEIMSEKDTGEVSFDDNAVPENKPYKVLIYHTHTSESFADSRKGVPEDTIAGVGAYLTKLLNEQYNIPTYHDETVYDVIDGKLDRSKAYENSYNGISRIIADNPSIEVVIDLHRDGVDEETHLVTNVNGKPTAKIMFLNGVSRSNINGDIDYLENPNKLSNLAFSFQLYLAGKEKYGDFVRKIYVRSLRYNLHVMPRATLIEAGAQNNTIEEEMNAMEPLADMLNKVLRNEE